MITTPSRLQDSIDLIDLVLSSQQDELVLFITVPSPRGPLYCEQTSVLAGGLNVIPLHFHVVTRPRHSLGRSDIKKRELEQVVLLRKFLRDPCSCGVWRARLLQPLSAARAKNTHIHLRVGLGCLESVQRGTVGGQRERLEERKNTQLSVFSHYRLSTF